MDVLRDLDQPNLRFGEKFFGDDYLEIRLADQCRCAIPAFPGDQSALRFGEHRLQLLDQQGLSQRTRPSSSNCLRTCGFSLNQPRGLRVNSGIAMLLR